MTSWLRRVAEVLHIRRPGPDDERTSQWALLRAVQRDTQRRLKPEHDKALRDARSALRHIGEEYAKLEVRR